MSAQQLQSTVQSLKQRTRLLGLAAGGLWALAAGLAVVIGWAWIDLLTDSPGMLRIAGWVLATGCVAGVLMVHWRRTLAVSRTPALARRLDRAAAAKGQILTGVDLLQTNAAGELTQGLATMAVARAANLASATPLSAAAPARPLLRALASFAGILVAVGLLALLAPHVVRTQWKRLADPFGDHAAYSHLQIHVQPGNVDVVYGGAIDIRAKVDGGAVEQLETVLLTDRTPGAAAPEPAEEVIPMFAEPDGTWRTALANIVSPGKYFVRARQARSDRFTLGVITVPKITAVAIHLTAPAYTHKPPYDGPVPAAGLAALPGTRVEIRARSNRPLSGGTLDFPAATGPRQITLAPASSGESSEVLGSFTVDAAGKFTLRVKDAAGQLSTDAFSATVTLLADERPFVRIIEPRAQSFATPDARIPVELMAEDDFGITSLWLYRSLNDSRALGLPLAVPPGEPTRCRATSYLTLAPLSLRPGDMIRLTGRVEDNDPAGAKGSESPSTTILIISQEEYQRMMIARAGLEMLLSKYDQAQRRLETVEANLRQMREALAKEKADAPLPAEAKKKNDAVAQDASDGAGEVAKARAMALPFDIDQSLTPHLDRISKRLDDVAAKLRENAANKDMKVSDQIALLDNLIGDVAQEEKDFAQDTTEPLDYLAKIFPLIADQEKFVQIFKRQSAIVEHLSGIKDEIGDDPRDKARLRDMEQEQKQIHGNLMDLLDAILSHAAALPDDERIDEFRKTAEKFARDLKGSEVDDHMTYAEQALGDFWVATAKKETAAALAILHHFIDEVDGGGGMGGQAQGALKFQPVLAKNLGNTVQQLLGAAGLGGGNGGGYSAGGLGEDNVGLYGRLPIATRGAGGGNNDNRVAGAGGESAPGSRGAAGSVAAGSKTATGANAVPVPAQYRRRVDEYFQRVADELQKE